MDKKEKLELLKEAEEIARENMNYSNKNKGRLSCLFIVVLINLVGLFLSVFLIKYITKFFNI
jgi:hypothetical protein